MKELSVEQKAKAYDEAFGRAKGLYAKGAPDSLYLEEMFPELKESEDEKIRKALISILKSDFEKDTTIYDISVGDIIAWLEKQGEPRVNMIQWKGDNLKEVVEFTGKSPKFGEWFKTWEEYENYVHSHGNIFKLFCEDGSHYEVPVSAWIVKTPDGYNIASKAKYKQNIEKKPAWSDLDSITAAINNLEYLKNNYVYHPMGLEPAITFLKSLKDRYAWKPSENELEVLRLAAEKDGTCLMGLYEQLKKLRKE